MQLNAVHRGRRARFRYLAEDTTSGYADAGDRLVRALREAGAAIEYRAFSNERYPSRPPRAHPHSRDPFPELRAPRQVPTVAHLVPELLPYVRRRYRRSPVISHTVWETDALPPRWAGLLNRTARVIVPTEWNREVFAADGVRVPISVVPHVVADPVPGDGGLRLSLPDDLVVFYTIGRWDERKQPGAVIRAFCDAFSADDPVALVVKTSPLAQFPAPEMWGNMSQLGGTTMLEVARIMRAHRRPPLVRVEIDDWTTSRVAGLHTRADCFVSLTHGEGWGLGAFDAAAYGNPVVMTDWGGSREFLDPERSYLVSCDVEAVTYFDTDIYGPGQHWAVPRHEHAVELLREVASDIDGARRRAESLRSQLLRDYSPSRVAEIVRDVVPELGLGDRRTPGAAPVSSPAPSSRDDSADSLVLLGIAVGPWRVAFDNWVAMAERFGYRYELIGREIAEPYVPHVTKWRVLLDHLSALPRDQVVFYLDASDAFVCDAPAVVLDRYRSYGAPVVFGAERQRHEHPSGETDPGWVYKNAGGMIGEAGIIADALREGFDLVPSWPRRGIVSDQHAMAKWFQQPGNEHLATVDDRREIVQNLAAAREYAERAAHEAAGRGGAAPPTTAVHFYGDNGRGYNQFAPLYGLSEVPLQPSGRFEPPIVRVNVPMPLAASGEPMPRVIHFEFGRAPHTREFHLVHALAIRSSLDVLLPDEVFVHCHASPAGPWWDLIEPAVTVSPVNHDDTELALEHALAKHGGLALGLDTLTIARFSERLWRAPAVVSRIPVVGDDGEVRAGVADRAVMAQPGSPTDGIHIESQRTFQAIDPTPTGLSLLLEGRLTDVDRISVLPLHADLWWDGGAPGLGDFGFDDVTDQWIHESRCTYASAARPHFESLVRAR